MQALLGDAAPSAAAGLLAHEQLPRWPEAVTPASVPDTATPAPPAPLPASATQRPQSSEQPETDQQPTTARMAITDAAPLANGTAFRDDDPRLPEPGAEQGTGAAVHVNQLDTVRYAAPVALKFEPSSCLIIMTQVRNAADKAASGGIFSQRHAKADEAAISSR